MLAWTHVRSYLCSTKMKSSHSRTNRMAAVAVISYGVFRCAMWAHKSLHRLPACCNCLTHKRMSVQGMSWMRWVHENKSPRALLRCVQLFDYRARCRHAMKR